MIHLIFLAEYPTAAQVSVVVGENFALNTSHPPELTVVCMRGETWPMGLLCSLGCLVAGGCGHRIIVLPRIDATYGLEIQNK
jgi:hypothetical protein